MRYQDTHDASLLTIAQAKEVWCPEARTLQQEVRVFWPETDPSARFATAPASCNRTTLRDKDSVTMEPSKAAMCLGDGCAFWRWHDGGARFQAHTTCVVGTLADDAPQAREGGRWQVLVPEFDAGEGCTFDSLEEAQAFATEDFRLPMHPTEFDVAIMEVLNKTACEFRFLPDPLPPRGFCGKAGHPYQAILLMRQMELRQFQLYDHRHE